MKKRILSAILVLVLALNILPLARAQAAAPKTLKVLAIGNSYSVDAMTYLYEVAKAQGAQEIVLGNLYISGCTLKTHRNNALSDKPAYEYYKNDSGEWKTTSDATLLAGLQDEKWDIISLQQASGQSGSPLSYNSDLDELVEYVNQNKLNPNAKLVWHMTWAYQEGYGKYANRYDENQEVMYRSICAAVQSKILPNPAFSGVIPSGTAVQNARGTSLGDNLNRDGTHMNTLGRVITSYTWYCLLTGDRPEALNFRVIPDGVSLKSGKILTPGTTLTAEQSDAIHRSVMAALDAPFGDCPAIYESKADDWFFFPGAPVAGELAEGYVFGSETAADGARVAVLIPANAKTGSESTGAGRFWRTDENGIPVCSDDSPSLELQDVIPAAGGSASPLSRGEAVQALYAQAGKPAVTFEPRFTDVDAANKYADAVCWAAKTGLVSGYGNGLFGVSDNVTTEQLAVMLWNKAGKPSVQTALEGVACSAWATSALNWCSAQGILQRISFETVTGEATRIQLAQVLAYSK